MPLPFQPKPHGPDFLERLSDMATGWVDTLFAPPQSRMDLGGPRAAPSSAFPPAPEENDDLSQLQQLAFPSEPNRRMAYSHSMQDLVQNKYVAQKPAPDPVPFYPSERHLKMNLAPEQTLGRSEMERLAAARFKAMDMGVLSREQADYMLPIAMVEGRPDSYGITHDNQFYASPHARRTFSQMGLEIADMTQKLPPGVSRQDAVNAIDEGDSAPPLIMVKNKRGEKMIYLNETASDYKPELMAAILSIKAKGTKSTDEMIERWNGAGEQARHYRGKVHVARKLLDHPRNQGLRSIWSEVTGED